ncbi:NAD(P)/FAD-dependent oxidoreductase [Aneurinibacillus terranovensis]|uniref:NAD(P)/FAD-dependent oxidoreductase n=1 Tax=Aneurinibacillus terranovensis TaxID=278991 RepID=UPI00041BC9D4|nr:NAD(P)/FAD-dependent oxidoreductase [Aneurinibacillus terranovensis]
MYDCAVIGGGIAGLQASVILGRYMHNTVVIDRHHGRSLMAKNYKNILGWPNGISGPQLREVGWNQAREVGVEFVEAAVIGGYKKGNSFVLQCSNGTMIEAKRLLISTGLLDQIPENIEGLKDVLGLAVYVCPDCDGYEIKDKRTLVFGAGDVGASLACMLLYWTKEVTYINHEPDSRPVSPHWLDKCKEKSVAIVEGPIRRVNYADLQALSSVELTNGEIIEGEKGFIAFGGNEPQSDLASQLGVERLENGHIPVDGRSKKTNVPNIWAAGDVVAHSQLVAIAMGDGAQAAIWIHKSLQK